MTNEERKIQYMNRNIKLSPPLIALTWDVIFIWTISTMYFTQVKNLPNSQVVMLDSILMLFGCLLCVPVGKLFQNVKPIKAIRIGLCGYAAYILLCVLGNSYPIFILAQFFLAFGYAIMAIKSNSVLTDSLAVVKRDKDYQRIYGKGISLLYIIECVGAIFITYVFNWNPNVAFLLSLVVVIIAISLTLFFKDPEKFQDKNIEINSHVEDNSKEAKSKKPDSYFKILKSGFLITLLIYAFLMRGALSITGSGFKIYLNWLMDEKLIPVWSYGYIYAVSRIAAALSSKYQFKFNLKFGVRSLIIFNLAIILTFTISGLLFVFNPTSIPFIVIIILLSYIQCSIRMPNQIFLNNYVQVCSSKKNVERIYSIRTMVEYLGYAAISAIYAGLIDNFGYGFTSLIYIGILVIPIVVSLTLFIKMLCKKYAEKYTVIKPEYTED